MNGPSSGTGEESCDGRNSDGRLLGRFVDQGDEDAFAVLVSRYHGLVLGACRRTLRDEHNVEDAFQSGIQPAAGTCSENAIRLAEKELAVKTPSLAVTASSLAVLVAIAGLTFARAGDASGQPGPNPAQVNLVAAQTALLDASPTESGEVPIRLARAGTEEMTEETAMLDSPGEFLSAAEMKIEAALREPTTLEFFDEPLQGVIDHFREKHKINILIDTVPLEAVGIASDEPVTMILSDVSLQSGLNIVLHHLDLTWIIRDEVLLITTQDEAEDNLDTKVYEVTDLVTYQDKSDEVWADHETLINVITTTIEPETWDEVGGVGSIEPTPVRGAEVLVVSHTRQVHQKIQRLLDQLRAIAQETGVGEPPVREKPTEMGGMMGGMGGGMGMGMGMPGSADAGQPANQTPTSRAPGMSKGEDGGNY